MGYMITAYKAYLVRTAEILRHTYTKKIAFKFS